MRIALVSEHASPIAAAGGIGAAGQGSFVLHVARQLARRGHAVDVYTRRDAPDLSWRVDLAPNLRVLHVAAGPARAIPDESLLRYMPDFSREVARVALSRGLYDVSHANFFMSGIASAALRREFGIPFAITFHDLGRVRPLHQGGRGAFPPERNQIEDMLVRFADRVVAGSPQEAADLVRLYGADRARMSCVSSAEALGHARAPGSAGPVPLRRAATWERVATDLEAVYESIISQENALEQTTQSRPMHDAAEVVS